MTETINNDNTKKKKKKEKVKYQLKYKIKKTFVKYINNCFL